MFFVLLILKFILFVLGAVIGFIAALFILPLPGNTFFNKMYRLPSTVKDFIDDAIELFSSVLRLYLSFVNWLYRIFSILLSFFNQLRAKRNKEDFSV